ncbi:MAG: hypothetical protein ACXIU8_06315 [Alkalilacustris sp.]
MKNDFQQAKNVKAKHHKAFGRAFGSQKNISEKIVPDDPPR